MAIESIEDKDPIEDGRWGTYGQWFFGETNPLSIGLDEADKVAQTEMERRGDDWRFLEKEGSPERSDEVMTVVEAVKAGFYSVELAEVVEELDLRFEEARVRWCRSALIRERMGNGKACSPKLLAAASDVDPSNRWDPMPDREYFKREVLPTLVSMVGDGEDLREMFDAVMESIPRLLQHQFQGTSNRTPGHVMKEFFKPFKGAHLTYSGIGASLDGQFEYFYKKYGKCGAMLAATYQGFFCDEHYCGSSYTKGIRRVEFALDEFLEKLPEEYRERGLRILVLLESHWYRSSFSSGSDGSVDKFLEYFPEVVQGLLANPPVQDGAEVYVKMIESSPSDFAYTIALHSLEGAVGELKAWNELGEHKDLGLRVYAMSEGVRDMGADREYGFVGAGYGASSISSLFKNLEGVCTEEEGVRGFFALLEASDMKDRTKLHVLESCTGLMGFFDSFEECITYLNAFADKKSLNSLILMLGSERLSAIEEFSDSEVKDAMLAKLAEFVEVMGHNAGEVMSYGGNFIKCYFEEPEKIDRMIALGRELPDLKQYGGLRACLFELAWRKHGPGQEAALAAFMKKSKDPSMIELLDENEDLYTRILVGMIREVQNIYAEEGEGGKTEYYPADFDYYRELCVLEHCLNNFHDIQSYYLYTRQVLAGADPNLMAYLLKGNEYREEYCDELYPEDIPGVVLPIDRKDGPRFVKAFRALMQIENGIGALVGYGDKLSKDRVCAVKAPVLQEWRGLRAEVVGYSEDEEFSRLFSFDSALKSLDQMFGILFIKDVMGIGYHSDRFKVKEGGLLAETNELTKSAITGSAFLAAIGAMEIDGVDLPKTNMMAQVQRRVLANKDFSADALMEIADSRQFRDSLHSNICLAIPAVEQAIIRERMRLIGVMPAGRKVHTRQAMDAGVLTALREIFSLYNTCFHLIHAGETMVMDPLPTSYELDLVTEILAKFGVIDRERPTLQFASGGRWSQENAPFASAANLLGASRRIQYEPGAFTTSHHETGARILAYDAGVKKSGLPFDLPGLDGRTDIMGRRDYDSARRYQLAGTVLAHLENGGRFAAEGQYFVDSMREIIRRRGLTAAFESSAWVFDHAKVGDDFEAHDNMIGAFTGANWDDAERANFGVIADVRRLESEVERRIQEKAWQVELEEPDAVAMLRKY